MFLGGGVSGLCKNHKDDSSYALKQSSQQQARLVSAFVNGLAQGCHPTLHAGLVHTRAGCKQGACDLEVAPVRCLA